MTRGNDGSQQLKRRWQRQMDVTLLPSGGLVGHTHPVANVVTRATVACKCLIAKKLNDAQKQN